MKIKRFFWNSGLPLILPIPVILGLEYWLLSDLEGFDFFILFFSIWLAFVISVGLTKYLALKISSIPRLIRVLFLALLVGILANFGGGILFLSVYEPPSNMGWGGMFLAGILLGFLLFVLIFNFLAILGVIIRQGSKNNLYTRNTEYTLYGIALAIGIIAYMLLLM